MREASKPSVGRTAPASRSSSSGGGGSSSSSHRQQQPTVHARVRTESSILSGSNHLGDGCVELFLRKDAGFLELRELRQLIS